MLGPPSATGYWVESLTCDFSDTDDIALSAFTNANYYIAIILLFDVINYAAGTTPYFTFTGAETEYATAAEAENSIESEAMTDWPWRANFPVCGVVLRNNGQVGVEGAFMPVDMINRGGSYIFNDYRPRHYAVYSPPE
jgi:hypothetical protein